MDVFGLHVEELYPYTTPFYVTLMIQNLLLHNYTLDLGSSHNLMPLSVMEQLGLRSLDHTKTCTPLTPRESSA